MPNGVGDPNDTKRAIVIRFERPVAKHDQFIFPPDLPGRSATKPKGLVVNGLMLNVWLTAALQDRQVREREGRSEK